MEGKKEKSLGEHGEIAKWSEEELTEKIIVACIKVHKELGPGFLESIYHNALKVEFEKEKLFFESEKVVQVCYHGVEVGVHKLDLLVEDGVILEIKAVEEVAGRFYAQVRSYLRAFGKKVGLLVNFANSKIDVRRVEVERL